MRITKSLLRQVKVGLKRRLAQIAVMDDDEITKEFQRCWPNRLPEGTPAFPAGKRKELLVDLVDLAIPDHWCE